MESQWNEQKQRGRQSAKWTVVIAMLRIGSLLMMILLTAPIVRDCCLPIAAPLPCHQSHRDSRPASDMSCAATLQAVSETKAGMTIKHWIVFRLPGAAPESAGV